MNSSPAAIAIGHSRGLSECDSKSLWRWGLTHQTDWQPHRLHLCQKATMIEIAGIEHSFDPVLHDDRSLSLFLFDSTSDADQFLSILAVYPHNLSRLLPMYVLWQLTFLVWKLLAQCESEKRSTVLEFSISTISPLSSKHCHHNHWFIVLAFSIQP